MTLNGDHCLERIRDKDYWFAKLVWERKLVAQYEVRITFLAWRAFKLVVIKGEKAT